MILVLDNYDSFTYNLVHLVARSLDDRNLFTNDPLRVVRNDQITLSEIRDLAPAGILISPGPGRPEDAKVSLECVKSLEGAIPILGVCLGHQIIGQSFGAKITYAPRLMHGKTSTIRHDGLGVFTSLPPEITATRYHSLIVDRASVPDTLTISAETTDGVVMGLRHQSLPLEGIQFHPESILTPDGFTMIDNWISRCLGGVPV